eukprot:COSAG01_NODE_170_length_23136_cov_24.853931_22_plen_288_part_00
MESFRAGSHCVGTCLHEWCVSAGTTHCPGSEFGMALRSHQNCASVDWSAQLVHPKVYSSKTLCAAPPHFTCCPTCELTQPALVAKVLPLQPGGNRIDTVLPRVTFAWTRQLGPFTKFHSPLCLSLVESAAHRSVAFCDTIVKSMRDFATAFASASQVSRSHASRQQRGSSLVLSIGEFCIEAQVGGHDSGSALGQRQSVQFDVLDVQALTEPGVGDRGHGGGGGSGGCGCDDGLPKLPAPITSTKGRTEARIATVAAPPLRITGVAPPRWGAAGGHGMILEAHYLAP